MKRTSPQIGLKSELKHSQTQMELHIDTRHEFAEFLLEPSERRLSRNGVPVDLRGKPFDLLVFLVRNQGRLVERDALLNAIWGGTNVGDHSLTVAINTIRKALDPGANERFIQTVAGKGYRFVQAIQSIEGGLGFVEPKSEPPEVQAVETRTRYSFLFAGAATVIVVVLATAMCMHSRTPRSKSRELYTSALALEQAGDDGLASASLAEAIRLDPNNLAAVLRAGWLLYQDDQSERAIKVLDRSLAERNIPDVVRLEAEGLRAMAAEDFETAQNKLDLAQRRGATDVEWFEWMIEIQFQRTQLDNAGPFISQCLKLNPANATCNSDQLELMIRRTDFEGALKAYPEASKTTNGNPWLDKLEGFAYLGLGRYQDAKIQFEKLSRFGKNRASDVQFRAATEGLAQVALLNERYSDAADSIENAMTISSSASEKTEYLLYLAGINALSGKPSRAIDDVKLAIPNLRTDEQRSIALRMLVLAGDTKLGRELLETRLASPHALSRRLLAAKELLLGLEAFRNSTDYDDAISHLSKAQGLDSDPAISFILAGIEMQHDDWEMAAKTLKSIRDDKGDILLDSFASLVPIAERNLLICAQHGVPVGHEQPSREKSR